MAEPSSAGTCSSCGVYVQKRYGGMGRYPVVCLDCWILGEASPELRERVARALYDWQIAFERKHSQRVVHPTWEVAYADYWGRLADAALAALGLDDVDAAVERVAARLKANVDDEYGYETPYDFTDRARAALEAAFMPPDAA